MGSRRTKSTESTSSVASTSSQRVSANIKDSGHEYATTAAVTTSYGKHLSDVCAILIHCPKHKKFALASCGHNGSKGLWLPYVTLRQSEGWYASIVNKVRRMLNIKIGTKSSRVFTPPEVMHIMRIQLPEVLKYVTRVVFMTNLLSLPISSPSSSNSGALHVSSTGVNSQQDLTGAQKLASNASLQASGHPAQAGHGGAGIFKCYCDAKDAQSGLVWYSHEHILSEEESLEVWGPEPAMFTSAFATNSVEKGAYSEYTLREAIRFQPRDPPRSYQEELLNSCHFERSDILRLYSDYVQHCYPSQNMNLISFRKYMLKIGYELETQNPDQSQQGQPIGQSQQAGQQGSVSSKQHVQSSSSRSSSSSAASGATGASAAAGGGRSEPSHGQPSTATSNHLNVHNLRSLYRAFKFNKMPYLTFHELLLGLAAMDRNTMHGGHTGELRCAYIYRYYDTNSDGQLSPAELRAMAYDRIRLANLKKVAKLTSAASKSTSASAKTPQEQQHHHHHQKHQAPEKSTSKSLSAAMSQLRIDQESVSRELTKINQQLKLKPGESISEANFTMAVGSMQLRGTSHLFRSQISVLPVRQHYEVIKEHNALTDIEGNLVGTEIARKGTCPRCKEKKYVLALHTVKLTHDAQIVEPTEVRFDEYPPPISRAQRQLSRAIFASDSTPNRLIDMITTYWNAIAASQSQAQNLSSLPVRMLLGTANAVPVGRTQWERIDRQTLAEDIRRVCSQADAIFKREARVVGVTSPCFVLGDIHGNMSDLRTYERILWPNAPTCVAGSYLFLGDYVDRGDYGLECICYLLSMKVLAPKAFFLLRGNHELRSIQQAFTFFRECCDKFRNQQLGVHVWETLNKTFDVMPVAGTIDDQIYCAHGGIPTSSLRLDELHSMPTPMSDPENQSPSAWEILWNDPVSSTEYSEYADLLRKQPGGQQAVANMQGYLPNTKRGTAFFFSEEAVKRFLSLNNLSHIIRAHECVPPGYALHCNGRVITIFSSSHYCGATNDAACILVEREKLRIIRLDTD